MLRRALLVLLVSLPLSAIGQPKLEPLPEAPIPPLPPPSAGELLEPPVTITPGPDDKVEDVVINGQRAVKLTMPNGTVYYLMPDERDTGIRHLGDSGLRVPMRVIKQF